MSYILDALRRADAERERGSVPGIHAQPAMLGEADGETRRPASRGLWFGAGLGLALLALLAWWFLGHDSPPPAAPPMAVTPLPVTPPPVLAAPAPVAVPAPAVVAAPAPVAAAPVAEAPRKPAPKVTVAAAAKPAPVASKPVARAAASTPSAPAATEPRVYALSELPDEIRRELPTLAVGGAMYSQNPANRLLIVNGQTFHEGDKLAPGLALEQIRLKSAVLEYKGYRYGITY
jgi:general secretion pathway protein B